MLQSLKNIFGIGAQTDFASLKQQGAIIVDVRTAGEFAGGHIKGSLNIPVDQLRMQLKKLPKKEQPVITCCASGMRSASAKSILMANGYTQVYNGGGWNSLQQKLSK
jgi:rhodanese-related sulfurtransferase